MIPNFRASAVRSLLARMVLLLLLPCTTAFAANVDVDCAAGAKIDAAILAAPVAEPVTVTIHGTCKEAFVIYRDDVTLQGATPSDGISIPDDTSGRVVIINAFNGAQDLTIRSMTIDAGNLNGVFCGSGTSVRIDAVTLKSNTSGVIAIGDSMCRISNSTLLGPTNYGFTGIYATTGAYVELLATTIDHFDIGALAQTNATFLMGAFNSVVTIKNNNVGILVEASGAAQLGNVVVENSTGDGILVNPASSVAVVGFLPSLVVRNNGGNGINLMKNSSAVLRDAAVTIEGNGGHTVTCGEHVGVVLVRLVTPRLNSPPHNCG